MFCTNFKLITNIKSKVSRGRCGFYNTIVDASFCKSQENKNRTCFKFEKPENGKTR